MPGGDSVISLITRWDLALNKPMNPSETPNTATGTVRVTAMSPSETSNTATGTIRYLPVSVCLCVVLCELKMAMCGTDIGGWARQLRTTPMAVTLLPTP
eukprot:2465101-Rhodomonas_salina.4